MTWHDPMVLIPALVAWNGFFFGLLKYLFDRQVKVIDARMAKIEDLERRVTKVEVQVTTRSPCEQYGSHQAAVKALHKRIDGQNELMSEQMQILGQIQGQVNANNRALDLMNQFLIEQGGRRG